MKHTLTTLTLLSLLSCASEVKKKDHFTDLKGCFLLYNLKSETFEKVIGDSCNERFPAYSTFKVPLAVMTFDAKVLKDENEVLKWNGVKESREEANRDQTAVTWMRDSIVWFSQRITPKLGEKKFQKYLNDFDYGNRDFSEGLTTAWLTSPAKKDAGLRITAYEQIAFMKKLWKETLPVSQRSMALTKKIMYLETSPKGSIFHGKTGSNFYDPEKKYQSGWFISHVTAGENEYLTVVNINDLKPYQGPLFGGARAKQITKDFLVETNLW